MLKSFRENQREFLFYIAYSIHSRISGCGTSISLPSFWCVI